EDPHDVLISSNGARFGELKKKAKLGTSSVRRQAQALRLRPDLEIVPLRGNVETRLAKLKRGEADATMLARAGLARLSITLQAVEILEDWLPALCQGAIGIEIRANDHHAQELVAPIDDQDSHLAIACERGFLAALDGSCRTPIAGLAKIQDGKIRFDGEVLTPDGRSSWAVSHNTSFIISGAHAAVVAMG